MGTEVRRYEDLAARGRRMQDSLQTGLLIFTIVSLVFTGGYNWRRVDELTATMKTLNDDYVRKDILAEQFKTMNAQLQALSGQLEDVKRSLRENPR